MATEKFFVFNEDGALKRLKGRIVRFLDNEDPTGSDKDAIRTSLEVSPDAAGLVQADIGTQPNEIPVNGMLGDMAYQSSDGVSVAKLEVTDSVTDSLTIENDTAPTLYFERAGIPNAHIKAVDENGTEGGGIQLYSSEVRLRTGGTERVRIDSSGRVGIGTASPSTNSHVEADDLVIGDGTLTYHGLSVVTNSSGQGSLMFSDGTGVNAHRGIVRYNHTADALELWQASVKRWEIGATGNLTPAAGLGIDFGSTTTGTGTVSGGLLDDYETGTFTPTLTPTISGSITLDTGFDTLSYTKVGRLVTINGQLKIYSVSSPVGQTTMSLPFTIRSIDNVDYSNNFGGAISYFSSSASAFQTTVYNGNNGNAYIYIPLPSFIGNDQLRFSFSFLAA